ncbi:MAG: hypothetical protein IT305_18555 [Chloroflexi bacterium]|nr:hypothetical protein [Chloroflexota bacterium]
MAIVGGDGVIAGAGAGNGGAVPATLEDEDCSAAGAANVADSSVDAVSGDPNEGAANSVWAAGGDADGTGVPGGTASAVVEVVASVRLIMDGSDCGTAACVEAGWVETGAIAAACPDCDGEEADGSDDSADAAGGAVGGAAGSVVADWPVACWLDGGCSGDGDEESDDGGSTGGGTLVADACGSGGAAPNSDVSADVAG